MIRRFLICLSFATWCFLNTWVEYAEGGVAYFSRRSPLTVVVPVLCLEAIVTLCLFGAWEFVRSRKLTRALPLHLLFLAVCAVPAGIAALVFLRVFPYDLLPIIRMPHFLPKAAIASLPTLALVLWKPRTSSLIARNVFLYSWPVLLVILIQAGRETLFRFPARAYDDGPCAAPVQSNVPARRAIWIIFDEMSQSVAFAHRPSGLSMPEFDRLKQSTFYATAASGPDRYTELALPSLILGRKVWTADPDQPNQLDITTSPGAPRVAWGSVPNVFDAARALGFDTALAGWYHPYGRILNRSLTRIYWAPGWLSPGVEEPFQPQPLLTAIRDRAHLQLSALPILGRLCGNYSSGDQRRDKIERVTWLQDRAVEIAADPQIGLALLHLPMPHPPGIYSRASGALTADASANYLDNLALADRTLGVLRKSIEDAGLWDRTAILVSADHGWRKRLWRGGPDWTTEEESFADIDTAGVPFLLKLPGQSAPIEYEKPFNTLITRRLLTAILTGDLTDPGKLADFIERNQGN